MPLDRLRCLPGNLVTHVETSRLYSFSLPLSVDSVTFECVLGAHEQNGREENNVVETTTPWFAVATIVAVLVGPIIAVLVTRLIDEHRAKKHRRWEIFRNLMCHRRTPMNVEFVGALNLIEIEFADDQRVIQAWKQLLTTFEKMATESLSDDQFSALIEERSQAQTRLLDAIARNLGTEIEQLDIYSGGYSPKGWFDLENEQAVIRRLFGEIALGHKAFPVIVYPPEPSNTPPVPSVKPGDPTSVS